MGQNKTPLIKALRNEAGHGGGTLYVFPSASEDIGLNINAASSNVALSHYALLNIPPVSIKQILFKDSDLNPEQTGTENINIVQSGINADNTIVDDVNGFGRALAMSIQNYLMNLDVAITNDAKYNYLDYNTNTEYAFWTWLQKTKILNSSKLELKQSLGSITYIENAYNKDNDVDTLDETIIKCFGSIDGGNTVQSQFGMFNETYVNIPTSYGAGPVLLQNDFRNVNNLLLLYDNVTIENKNLLEGMKENQYLSYLGYDKPFYDTTSNGDTAVYKYNFLRIEKDPLNMANALKKFNRFNNIDINSINSYDDINIDTKKQLNVDTEFDFNTILLYYSVFDNDINTSVKTPKAINLFGIIFLDSPILAGTNEAGDNLYYIQGHKKTKSTEKRFGNSFSFRLNLKTLGVYDNSDAVINDETTLEGVKANNLGEVVGLLNNSIDIMYQNTKMLQKVLHDYKSIKDFYTSQSDKIDDISTLLKNYIQGKGSDIIDVNRLYTNEIWNKGTAGIKVYLKDISNNINDDINPQPIITIDKTGFNTGIINSNIITSLSNYIHIDPCTAFNNSPASKLNLYKNLLSDNTLIKEIYDNTYSIANSISHEKIYNLLCINPNGNIFTNNSSINLSYLKNENSDINYTGLIPHIIKILLEMSIPIVYNMHQTIISELLNTYDEYSLYITKKLLYFNNLSNLQENQFVSDKIQFIYNLVLNILLIFNKLVDTLHSKNII